MHLPAIWRSKFTDLATRKKLIFGVKKTTADKSVSVKAWVELWTLAWKM